MEITGLNQNYNIRPTKSMRQASTPIDGPRDIAFGLRKVLVPLPENKLQERYLTTLPLKELYNLIKKVQNN